MNRPEIAVFPPSPFQRSFELFHSVEVVLLTRSTFLSLHNICELREDVVEEEAQPNAFSAALAADLVESVVPVARTDQR